MKVGRKPGPSIWSRNRIQELEKFVESGQKCMTYDPQFERELGDTPRSIRLALNNVIDRYYPCPVSVCGKGDKTFLVRTDIADAGCEEDDV